MVAEVLSGALVGVECRLVRVEVSVAPGLPAIHVVGLAQGAVREGKDRVRSALQSTGYRLPAQRITVNLAPAELRKEGSGLDLPLAIGLLGAAGHLPADALEGGLFAGELGLDGELRPIRGALPLALAAHRAGARYLVLPHGNLDEAAPGAPGIELLGATSLCDVVAHLTGRGRLAPHPPSRAGETALPFGADGDPDPGGQAGFEGGDLSEVRGHPSAKRALEVAAAGGHPLLLTGPPGSGKTMLARRLPGILPPLSVGDSLEVTAIHSVAGLLPPGSRPLEQRPFRAPHHTISTGGLIGGGSPPRPGEVSLAHHGVLFLDELPEFSRATLDTLRQPLEEGAISLVRVRERVQFPARFTLVAAMNPCPCGHLGDPRRPCLCDPTQVTRYRSRVSGPLRDRLDLRIEVPALRYSELRGEADPHEGQGGSGPGRGESSHWVRARVVRARGVQSARQGRVLNADLSAAQVDRFCALSSGGERLLEEASDRMTLSARGIHRILRVARTIADLADSACIEEGHLAEAIHYRG